jgi:hypothetical protein
VNDVEGDARLNGEQPPGIGLIRREGGDPVIVVVWTTNGASGTTLRQSRSEDGGRSFVRSSLVRHRRPGQPRLGSREHRTLWWR